MLRELPYRGVELREPPLPEDTPSTTTTWPVPSRPLGGDPSPTIPNDAGPSPEFAVNRHHGHDIGRTAERVESSTSVLFALVVDDLIEERGRRTRARSLGGGGPKDNAWGVPTSYKQRLLDSVLGELLGDPPAVSSSDLD